MLLACFNRFVVLNAVSDAEQRPELVPMFVGVVLGLLVDLDDAGGLAAEIFGVVDVLSDVRAAVPGEIKERCYMNIRQR